MAQHTWLISQDWTICRLSDCWLRQMVGTCQTRRCMVSPLVTLWDHTCTCKTMANISWRTIVRMTCQISRTQMTPWRGWLWVETWTQPPYMPGIQSSTGPTRRVGGPLCPWCPGGSWTNPPAPATPTVRKRMCPGAPWYTSNRWLQISQHSIIRDFIRFWITWAISPWARKLSSFSSIGKNWRIMSLANILWPRFSKP
jgi:hypothetical protein